MKRVSIYTKLLLTLLFFLIISFIFRGQGETDFADKILSVTSFIFGITLAFSISNRYSRLSSIREKLRKQDAKLLEIYYLSKKFNKNLREKIKEKIDSFLIVQLDYNLVDYNKEVPEKTKEFFFFLEKLKLSGEEDRVRKDILKILEEIIEINKEISYQVENDMAPYEWIVLSTLAAILFFVLIYFYNTNTLISIVIIAFLNTALCLMLFILNDLDSLRWQERNWIWKPLANLFVELDLFPYFHEEVFSSNRISFKDVKKWDKINNIRIAYFPNPYPDMNGKKVKLVNLKLVNNFKDIRP
jgi:Na+/melibiose symporter-like transporter